MSLATPLSASRLRIVAAVLSVAAILATVDTTFAEDDVTVRYTALDLDGCQERTVDADGRGASLRCEGLPGIPVLVSEGDLRFDVDFGLDDGRSDTFGPFNSPGETVEWRLADGVPFAAILRFRIEDPEGGLRDNRAGSVLGIFRVGRQGTPGCPVAYVDATLNADANLVARQAADGFGRDFRCGIDRAIYLGRTGPLSGNATATYAE